MNPLWVVLWAMSIVPCFLYVLARLKDVYGYVAPSDAVLVLLVLLASVPVINILMVIAVWLAGADSNLDRTD